MATDAFYTLKRPAASFYQTLVTPEPFKDETGKAKGDPKYSISIAFPSDSEDLRGIATLCKALAAEKFGAGVDYKALVGKPYRPGQELIEASIAAKARKSPDKPYEGQLDWLKGMWVLKASSVYAPALSALEGGKLVEMQTAEQKAIFEKAIYSGVEVLAQFKFTPVMIPAKRSGQSPEYFVAAYLQMVLTTGKGTRHGGAKRTAAEVFRGYAGAMTDADPTGGEMAEEIF